VHDTEALHRLELAVLDLFVAGDDPVCVSLREQLAASHVARREWTEVGFFTFFEVPAHARRLPDAAEFLLDDVAAELDGAGRPARFVLAVRDGALDFLEGVILGERWPDEPALRRAYYVRRGSGRANMVVETRERDWDDLRERVSG
jgi:hypothetical protein